MFITRVIKDLLASSNEKDFQRNNKEDIDTYQFVKNSTLHVVLKTFYSMFGNMMKHSLEWFISLYRTQILNSVCQSEAGLLS